MTRGDAARRLKQLVAEMGGRRASHVLISAGFPPAFKIDGELEPAGEEPLSLDDAYEIVTCVMPQRHRNAFETARECSFTVELDDVGRFATKESSPALQPGDAPRVRVSAYFQRGCPAMVLRPVSAEPPLLADLGQPEMLGEIALAKRGLVLVVGSSDAGTSRTLAAMVDHRNRNSRGHIVSVESPIEYVHAHRGCMVSQREVGLDTEDWEVALASALTQAPDVIVLGHGRDRDAVRQGVEIANIGLLALVAMHGDSAEHALDRVSSFFSGERRAQQLVDLSLNLKAIVAQRLVRGEDGAGQAVATEIMLTTPLIAERIAAGEFAQIAEAMEKAREQGMQTFDQSLFELYESGRISMSVALRHAESVSELRQRIKHESKRGDGARSPKRSGKLEILDDDKAIKLR